MLIVADCDSAKYRLLSHSGAQLSARLAASRVDAVDWRTVQDPKMNGGRDGGDGFRATRTVLAR